MRGVGGWAKNRGRAGQGPSGGRPHRLWRRLAWGLVIWLGTRLAAGALRCIGQPCGCLENCPAWPPKLPNPRRFGGLSLGLIKAARQPTARWLRLARLCTSVCAGRFVRAPSECDLWQCPGWRPTKPTRPHWPDPQWGAHASAPSVRHQTSLRCGCAPHGAPHGRRCGNRHWLANAGKAMRGASSSVMGGEKIKSPMLEGTGLEQRQAAGQIFADQGLCAVGNGQAACGFRVV